MGPGGGCRCQGLGGLPDEGLVNTRSSFKPPNAAIFREVAADVGAPGAASFPGIWLFRVEALFPGRNMAFSFSSHVAGGHFFHSSNHQQLSGLCGNTWAVLGFNLLVIECRWVHVVQVRTEAASRSRAAVVGASRIIAYFSSPTHQLLHYRVRVI